MREARRLLLLGGAAVMAVGTALLFQPESERREAIAPGALAFPGLAARLPDVQRVEIRRGDARLNLLRVGEGWAVAEAHSYLARPERVRELLTGLTELRLTEERTSDPAMLSRLGVEDPQAPGSSSTLLRLLGADGSPIVELILGRRRVRTQGNVPETVYVRRPGEARAWLAEGRLAAEQDPQLWLDRDIANIAPARIRRVEVARAGEAPLVIGRHPDGQQLLRIEQPESAPAADPLNLDEVGRAFEMLTFIEVRPEAEIPGEALGEGRFELTDGLAIAVWASRDGNLLWIRLRAEGTTPEATALNARWRGWAYQVGVWKEKAMVPRLEDLLPS
ncbi:MAG: DUF4340 domain-containing protein [Acetobacteraceae bacterium]|nr:DUF4340 domain-containing protein [Acetobacteraceae bacterium]